MARQRVTLKPDGSVVPVDAGEDTERLGRIDPERVDATTEDEIARQAAADDAEAMREVARRRMMARLEEGAKLSGLRVERDDLYDR